MLSGTLSVVPVGRYVVEVFGNADGRPGTGEVFLGELVVVAGDGGEPTREV